MNNLSSYCVLTDARIRASDTDLPVLWSSQCHSFKMYLVITVFCIYVSTRTSKYNLRWRHWTDLETFFCVGDSPRRWFLDLLSNRFTLENICNTSEHICMLGVSPSLVSRYCEGYSFWSLADTAANRADTGQLQFWSEPSVLNLWSSNTPETVAFTIPWY